MCVLWFSCRLIRPPLCLWPNSPRYCICAHCWTLSSKWSWAASFSVHPALRLISFSFHPSLWCFRLLTWLKQMHQKTTRLEPWSLNPTTIMTLSSQYTHTKLDDPTVNTHTHTTRAPVIVVNCKQAHSKLHYTRIAMFCSPYLMCLSPQLLQESRWASPCQLYLLPLWKDWPLLKKLPLADGNVYLEAAQCSLCTI